MNVRRVSLIAATLLASVSAHAAKQTLPLAGEWRFKLDAEDAGVEQKWFARKLADTIHLPGTTDENKKGIFKDEQAVDRLSRVWYWKGPAWYQREVTIPDAWAGKRITLFLERTKNTPPSTMVDFSESIDGIPVPMIGHETGAFQVSPAFAPKTELDRALLDKLLPK